jgi:hypothetical protein
MGKKNVLVFILLVRYGGRLLFKVLKLKRKREIIQYLNSLYPLLHLGGKKGEEKCHSTMDSSLKRKRKKFLSEYESRTCSIKRN